MENIPICTEPSVPLTDDISKLFIKHKPRWCDIINTFSHKIFKNILKIPEKYSSSASPFKGNMIDCITDTIILSPSLFIIFYSLGALQDIWSKVDYWECIYLSYLRQILSTPSLQRRPRSTPKKGGLTIGVIPDGNRRWSKIHSLPNSTGHFIGAARIGDIIRYCIFQNKENNNQKINHLIIYVLSYDNYTKRSIEEQTILLEILRCWLEEFDILNKTKQASFAIIGEPSSSIQDIIGGTSILINPPEWDKEEKDNLQVSLLICYDGRREIIQSKGDPSKLWIQSPIDFVIRTGNTKRASGFCTYQTAYSEWFYPDILWPDMDILTFNNLVNEGINTHQNYGK
jgi:short-chain Z-isoprenyl diphosphate synthase